MTRKDYILIADVLNKQFKNEHMSPTDLAISIMNDLLDAFEADNARFDPDKFEHAVWDGTAGKGNIIHTITYR